MTIQELINYLKTQEHFILAIDGMCASGKSTLATYLQSQFGGHVFHMDDFYLPLELRTKQRFIQPGGNIHYERFLTTVLEPLIAHESVFYQPFDCSRMQLTERITEIPYHPFNIIEGSYALRPELLSYYTDVIVLKITSQEQIIRLQKRNKDIIDQFIEKWIPLENRYFQYYHIYEKYPVITMEELHIM